MTAVFDNLVLNAEAFNLAEETAKAIESTAHFLKYRAGIDFEIYDQRGFDIDLNQKFFINLMIDLTQEFSIILTIREKTTRDPQFINGKRELIYRDLSSLKKGLYFYINKYN